MPELLHERQPFDFHRITTEDESWFQYYHEPQEMFALSREQVGPYVQT
jgi:hypothetical protein